MAPCEKLLFLRLVANIEICCGAWRNFLLLECQSAITAERILLRWQKRRTPYHLRIIVHTVACRHDCSFSDYRGTTVEKSIFRKFRLQRNNKSRTKYPLVTDPHQPASRRLQALHPDRPQSSSLWSYFWVRVRSTETAFVPGVNLPELVQMDRRQSISVSRMNWTAPHVGDCRTPVQTTLR